MSPSLLCLCDMTHHFAVLMGSQGCWTRTTHPKLQASAVAKLVLIIASEWITNMQQFAQMLRRQVAYLYVSIHAG